MNLWKNSLLDAYRYTTWPWRAAFIRQMKQSRSIPLAVLFYHRVANDFPNPWTISETGFLQQIDWLQKNFELISLAEVQRRIRDGNSRPAVSITFDDGYSDNCSFALPLLVERGIPVTYFVTTHYTTHQKPFPHDVARNVPLPANSIESLRAMVHAGVVIGGHTRTHGNLGLLTDAAEIHDEVIAATREMESMLDTPIQYFAFPFGQMQNLNPQVFKLLADQGFSGVCSAYGGFNAVNGDSFHLQRIHGDPNFARLRNWLAFDPRMVRVKKYNWQQALKLFDGHQLDSRQNGPENATVVGEGCELSSAGQVTNR